MGFWDSFIILFVLGFFSHYFYIQKDKKKNNRAWVAHYSLVVVLVVLIYSFCMYVGWMDWLLDIYNKIPWIASDPFVSGKDYMWNSFRFIGANPNITSTLDLDSIAALLFLCYIPVYGFAKWLSESLFGRFSNEKGLLWALLPVKKPESVE